MASLFTYGSLMCSDIMYHVAGCRVAFLPATLYDFRRSRIAGEEYPGIVSSPGDRVEGILYLGLAAAAIDRLDAFEGHQYLRESVQVATQQSPSCKAMAYIIRPQYSHLLTGEPWDFNTFLAAGKERFLADYLGFQKI